MKAKLKTPRKCSVCGEPGHRADRCESGGAPVTTSGPSSTSTRRPAAASSLVASEDLPAVKEAVVGVVDALEKIDPEHRPRVLRSAQVILGGDF